MRVRIDESRQNNATAKVQFFGSARRLQSFDPLARSNRLDPVATNQHRAVTNDSKITKGPPAPGN